MNSDMIFRTWIFVCAVYVVICPGTFAYHIVSCENLKINSVSVVYGWVDKSAVKSASCTGGVVSKVMFRIMKSDNTIIDICELPYPGCSANLQSTGEMQCQCVSSSASLNEYNLQFSFDDSYVGSSLRISTDCLALPTETFSYHDCDNLRASDTPSSDEGGYTEGETAGIAIGVAIFVGAVCIAVTAAICNRYHKKKEEKNKNNKVDEKPVDPANPEGVAVEQPDRVTLH
ncbi:uncharacterized protein LOC143277626 [Babylonia areolata]|uniref:uncharacterized protein LOC143277626 n=1 Tax=Babylonia areolata TaxID=304850 RepID=UPI003FD64B84